MPPKSNRNSVVNIKNDELFLSCEWEECQESFKLMDKFMCHVSGHLNQYFQSDFRNTENNEGHKCLWRECGAEIEGEPSDFVRHVYFHTFHVKIKSIGTLLIEKTGQRPCSLDTQSSRNLIPELPERLECGWEHCHFMFENAEMFYRHVENHGDSFPEGNNVKNGCKCGWDDCGVTVKSKHKLKDHLRSHTQEKLVACPTCGALFSSRTKFIDHLNRQIGSYTGKRYQCSHCNRTFASERLLRDHMRGHLNQYKCPYCDMTSPSPSCLRLHIRYRHSEEKPFRCDQCDHSCKTQADLKKHLDRHNDEDVYHCMMAGCQYSTRGFQSLTNHYKYSHQTCSYGCHVCSSVFSRGTLLTRHLKNVHGFNWPSGHSRFRYKLHSDGLYRLQTVRYETIQLSTQPADQVAPPTTEMTSIDTPPENSNTCGVQINLETFDALNDQNSKTTEEEIGPFIPSTEESEGQMTFVNHNSKKRQIHQEIVNSKVAKVLSDSSNLEDSSKETEEVVKIRITMNEDGQCLLQTEDMPLSEAVAVSLPSRSELEENMYNLRMLGEVALQNQTKKLNLMEL